MDEQKKQTIFEPAKVVAVGIAAPIASVMTSRFGIAGTLLGLALSSVILTIIVDALKVYLARASTKVVQVPSGLRTVSRKGIRGRARALLSGVLSYPPRSLSPGWRRSILIGSLVTVGLSFLVGLIIVTGVEASVGKNLSCWVWNECPTESSADGGRVSSKSTTPSIFGGGSSVNGGTSGAQPPSPQQPAPDGSKALPQSKAVPGSGQPSNPPEPGQRWSPSGVPEEQQPSEEDYGRPSEEDYQQPSEEDYRQPSEEDYQRPSEGNEGDSPQQKTPAANRGPNSRQPIYT